MLGDNSACSGRRTALGGIVYWVDRDLLIGKVRVIYWPHSWDKVTIFGHDIPFPFFPNFRKMGFVRSGPRSVKYVGWVERSEPHHEFSRVWWGSRPCCAWRPSTHPTGAEGADRCWKSKDW